MDQRFAQLRLGASGDQVRPTGHPALQSGDLSRSVTVFHGQFQVGLVSGEGRQPSIQAREQPDDQRVIGSGQAGADAQLSGNVGLTGSAIEEPMSVLLASWAEPCFNRVGVRSADAVPTGKSISGWVVVHRLLLTEASTARKDDNSKEQDDRHDRWK